MSTESKERPPHNRRTPVLSSGGRSLFIDHARVYVRGGRGGDGCMSFRREKYVPLGGPDGGSGGRGGDVYLRADPQKTSLLDVSYNPHFQGAEGKNGQGSDKVGRSADDLVISLPIGTMVFRDGKLLVDLKSAGDTYLAARGGRGGRGNAAFKTQRNTAPELSENGEPGEEATLDLELKLLADIGLIGCPNAGKSTLLSRLTSARPKIADYPFTTLNPNLGVADWHGQRMTVADIPGLIEGAHAGKGLGHDFLRHVERTRVLFHLVDVYGYADQDAVTVVRLIHQELKLYSAALAKKPMLLVVNKIDLTGAEDVVHALKKKYKRFKVFPISAVTGEGIDPLLKAAARELAKPVVEEADPAGEIPFEYVVERDFEVLREGPVFLIKGVRVERLAAMTRFNQEEGFRRFQNILKKMGVERELTRQGAISGDTVQIGKIEFQYEPTTAFAPRPRRRPPGD